VDRRSYAPPIDRPVFLWEDEAHYFTIESDALFQTTARSKGICIVRLSQNLPNYLDAYGSQGEHKVNTLLGNHVWKIACRNGDPKTNAWMTEIIGKADRHRRSASMTAGQEASNISVTVSEVYEDACPSHYFKELKNGGS